MLRTVATGLAFSTTLLVTIPSAAQIDPRSVPSGSPIGTNQPGQDGEGTRSDREADDRSSGAGQGYDPYRPVQINSGVDEDGEGRPRRSASDDERSEAEVRLKRPPEPSEFERYVEQAVGREVPRFGAELLVPAQRDFAVPSTSAIPPDYALNVGDTVSIAMTGSIEGSADFQIDRNGRIFVPKVGNIDLVGVRYRDLKDRVSAAIGRQYRGYEVTVAIKELRGIRVYVTGFANNPGAFTVTSLSTMANAVLAAGGPNAGGSFRTIKLIRNGREVTEFDLYDLLRGGDRSRDAVLQNEDVLFIPPVGDQVAIVGSVNEEAIYEIRRGESVEQALALAGGPNGLADASRVVLYSQADKDTFGSREIARAQAGATLAVAGDIIQVLSQGSLARPLERQSVIIRLEGEVNKPGNYFVAPNTPLSTVLEMAGGLTPRAYVYGTKFSRESVRAQQRTSYREAVEQLETTLAGAPLVGDRTIDAGERAAQLQAARALLEKLKEAEPDGRLVLSLPYGTNSLPGDLVLENNDRLVVPPLVKTVGVFGAVYRPASFLLTSGKPVKVRDYLERAGGTLRTADRANVFVVRANGEVLTRKRGAMAAAVQPGDVVFVPVKTQSSSLLAKIRDFTTILFQFGLTAAAVAAID